MASLLGLFYIYGGYLLLLKTLSAILPRSWSEALSSDEFSPAVSVYFSALNEEEGVRGRLENLIDQDYPPERLEIIAVSDGSTDRTAAIVREVIRENPGRDIRLIEFPRNLGQSEAQNAVAREAKYGILLSTDVETRFPENLISEIIKPFSDPRVAVVGAVVIYDSGSTEIGETYSRYRDMETAIREHESALGIGVKIDGPCAAYLKSIWEPITGFEDADQVAPLFARKDGYITVQAAKAVAWDKANTTPRREIKQRSRMTRKALLSTFHRWGPSDTIRHPGFAFALFSHKVVRFFSPVFALLALIFGALFINKAGAWTLTLICLGGFALVLAAASASGLPMARKLPVYAKSLMYSNFAYLLGIIGWIAGHKKGYYKPTSKY